MKILFAVAVTLYLIAPGCIAQDGQCDSLLRSGVFDSSSKTVEINSSYTDFHWVCGEEIRESKDVDNKSAELGFAVYNVPVKLGWNESDQDFSSWKNSFCGSRHVQDRYNEKRIEFVRTVSKDLVDGFIRCIGSPGVHVWRSPAANGELAFSANFVSLEKDRDSAELIINSSDGVVCEESRVSLTRAVKHVFCKQEDNDRQVVYFSSNVYRVVPESLVISSPPARRCENLPSSPININFDKHKGFQKQLGPYCVNSNVSMRFYGVAGQNSAGNPYSMVTIYSSAIPSQASFLCNSRVKPRLGVFVEHKGGCPSFHISAYEERVFSVEVDDASADTENLIWTIELKPVEE